MSTPSRSMSIAKKGILEAYNESLKKKQDKTKGQDGLIAAPNEKANTVETQVQTIILKALDSASSGDRTFNL